MVAIHDAFPDGGASELHGYPFNADRQNLLSHSITFPMRFHRTHSIMDP